MNRGQRGEEGYALVGAVVSMVVFALMALIIINAVRSSTVIAVAEIERLGALR